MAKDLVEVVLEYTEGGTTYRWKHSTGKRRRGYLTSSLYRVTVERGDEVTFETYRAFADPYILLGSEHLSRITDRSVERLHVKCREDAVRTATMHRERELCSLAAARASIVERQHHEQPRGGDYCPSRDFGKHDYIAQASGPALCAFCGGAR